LTMLSRRSAFGRILATLAGVSAAGRASAGTVRPIPRVAYHLSDLDKVQFALGNIENHIAGEGGSGQVEIVLVVNGAALGAFRLERANAKLAAQLARVAALGVVLGACGNTLDAQKISVSDLLPGFVRLNEGGVVRLARLQRDGYAYIRP
jgi:intracellular sulfur oxidation DsrE/DsrF family protein